MNVVMFVNATFLKKKYIWMARENGSVRGEINPEFRL